MKQYKIEQNTVQETMIIHLYGRRLCSKKFPELFQDRTWSDRFRVSGRGYMMGYQKQHDPAVKPIHRLLARIADNWMKQQIVRMDFACPED